MARPGGFEPPTAWFVARYSIQLSYGRTYLKTFKNGALGRIRTYDRLVRSQVLYPAELRAHFLLKSNSSILAVREGFEPSIRLQTVYSLSRGAPSASRPPHRYKIFDVLINGALGRIRTYDRLVRSQVLYPAELRARCINGSEL